MKYYLSEYQVLSKKENIMNGILSFVVKWIEMEHSVKRESQRKNGEVTYSFSSLDKVKWAEIIKGVNKTSREHLCVISIASWYLYMTIVISVYILFWCGCNMCCMAGTLVKEQFCGVESFFQLLHGLWGYISDHLC